MRRAFASFDAMFAIVPALVMIFFVVSIAHSLTEGAEERLHQQETFDKLVSIADYVVKQGAVVTEPAGDNVVSRPNWIDEGKLTDDFKNGLETKSGITNLAIEITHNSPGARGTCVYRLVVAGQEKEITKLYVCGE